MEKTNRFMECIHCNKFFSCKDKKYKRENCLNFEQEKEEKESVRSKVDKD